MPEQGISDVYIGTTSDTTTTLTALDIRHITTPQEISIKPKVNSDSAYAANRKVDSADTFDSADITLGIYDVDAALQAYILSQSRPAEGGVVEAAEDEGEYKCVFYQSPLRRTKVGGTRVTRYGWVYKTKFQPYDTQLKTLEGKPDLGNGPSLSGTAQATDFSYKNEKNQIIHPWRWYVDDDDPNCPADIATSWYQYLHVPGADVTAPTVTTTPINGATAVLASADIVWTYSKALNPSSVNAGNFVVIKSDGTGVSGSLSLDATGKIVTFTPTASLTAGGTYFAIASQNVTDVFGILPLSANTISFTVATA